jgi:putative transposase
MPFPIRALQVGSGSEFAAEFEAACQRRGLRLFVLPPRSPKRYRDVAPVKRVRPSLFIRQPSSSQE